MKHSSHMCLWGVMTVISVSVSALASTWYLDIDHDDYGNCNIPNNGIDEDFNGEDLVDPVPVEGTSWSLLKARYR